MSDFWEKKGLNQPTPQQYSPQQTQQPVEIDQEAMNEITEPEYNVFEDEDQDDSVALQDANLRLEMGRLYQMVMNNNIFVNMDSDPQAVKIVQRQIRKLARDQMEIMLGMRSEQKLEKTIVSSPFNDTEVTVLKMLASKMTKGASESTPSFELSPTPKKDTITAISGTTNKTKPLMPIRKETKISTSKTQTQVQSVSKSPAQKETSGLTKPIEQMTPEELLAYDQKSSERHKQMYAKLPDNMVPMPSPQQLEALYTVVANQNTQNAGTLISGLMKR